MSTGQGVPARGALREPMVWLVWGLPAIVVVAGFITLGIAIRSGNLDASNDPVRRMAQIQQTDISADRTAGQQGLGASLALREGRIALQMLGEVDASQVLTLRFEHPTSAQLDRSVTLQRDGDIWVAELDLPEAAGWHLTLTPEDQRWRLDGRLDASRIAILKPRFGHG